MDGMTSRLLILARDSQQVDQLYQVVRGYCHTVKNRLNCLRLALYLADRPEGRDGAWDEVDQRYREIEQFIERFHTFCRPLTLMPLGVSLGMILEERRPLWSEWLAARNRSLLWSPPKEDVHGHLDPTQLTTTLDGLVRWRAQIGPEGAAVRVAWRAVAGRLRLHWTETASATPTGGTRTEPVPVDRPPCLALPLLARVAAAHGGGVQWVPGSGFRIEIDLPGVAETPQPPDAGRRLP